MKVFKKMLFLIIMAAGGWFAQQEASAIDLDTVWIRPNTIGWDVQFSPGGDSLFVRTNDDSIKIYRTSNGNLLKTMWVDSSTYGFAVIPNSNFILTCHSYDENKNFYQKPLIKKWNTTNDSSTVLLSASGQGENCYRTNNLRVSRDGSQFLFEIYNNKIDIQTGHKLPDYVFICNTNPFYIKKEWQKSGNSAYECYQYSPADDIIAVGRLENSISLYSSTDYSFIDSMPKQPAVYNFFISNFFQFSNDGSKLFSYDSGNYNDTSRNEIGIYDIPSRTNTKNINLGEYELYSLKYCNSKNQVYTFLSYYSFIVYNVLTKDSLGALPFVPTDFDISPNSQYIAIADTSDALIMLRTPDFPSEVLLSIQKPDIPVLYPNPTSGVLNINEEFCTASKKNIKVYSEKGNLLGTLNENAANNSNLQFDLGNYSAGIYFVGVKCGEVEKFYKVVKY